MLNISFNFINKIKRNLFPFYKDKELKFVFNKIQEGSSTDMVTARFVGGCVRKYLSNNKIDDIDIATTLSAEEIKERISHLGDLIDADGSGQIDALTDGLLILRFLFGLEGDDLTKGVLAPDATRDSGQVYGHLLQLTPQIPITGN